MNCIKVKIKQALLYLFHKKNVNVFDTKIILVAKHGWLPSVVKVNSVIQ